MGKITTKKPLFVLMYGMSGSGKTFFARQLCEQLQSVHLEADRIRTELFEKPSFSKEENHIVASLMAYMAGEFLRCGVSVVFDMQLPRVVQRKALRALAERNKAETITVWFQIDPDTAFNRAVRRDRRTADDRFAQEMTPELFRTQLAALQNPGEKEAAVVVSGKHVFTMQKNTFFRELRQRRLVDSPEATSQVTKPGLINLVPNPSLSRAPMTGRVDMSRRVNIH